MLMITIGAWLGFFSFLYILVLVASPRSCSDSDNNMDYRKVFWRAVALFTFIVFLFVVLALLQNQINT